MAAYRQSDHRLRERRRAGASVSLAALHPSPLSAVHKVEDPGKQIAGHSPLPSLFDVSVAVRVL